MKIFNIIATILIVLPMFIFGYILSDFKYISLKLNKGVIFLIIGILAVIEAIGLYMGFYIINKRNTTEISYKRTTIEIVEDSKEYNVSHNIESNIVKDGTDNETYKDLLQDSCNEETLEESNTESDTKEETIGTERETYKSNAKIALLKEYPGIEIVSTNADSTMGSFLYNKEEYTYKVENDILYILKDNKVIYNIKL